VQFYDGVVLVVGTAEEALGLERGDLVPEVGNRRGEFFQQ
jgi:hypothetical protein